MTPARPTTLDGLLLTLTLVAGYMDALSYLGLNGAFTANMTGNLVLLGLAAGQAAGDRALGSGMAIVGFALGAASGGRVLGQGQERTVWPWSVTIALGVELVVLTGFAVGWRQAEAQPSGPSVAMLITIAAMAMGIQSAVGRRLGVSGVSTTYVTGTLTSLMTELVLLTGTPAGWLRWAGVLGVTVAGALIGAVTLHLWPLASPLLPVVLLAAVTAVAVVRYRPSQ